MGRTVNKAKSFAEADECEIRQHLAMTPQERMRVAKQLKERAYLGKIRTFEKGTRLSSKPTASREEVSERSAEFWLRMNLGLLRPKCSCP